MNKLILLVFFLSTATLSAQSLISGVVYEDLNQNSKRDANEQGIGNVAVSNGKEVVLTDTKGAYSLPSYGDEIVFVIKPKGYKVVLDAYNIPKFFYINKQNGSPTNYKYKGVAPTSKLPKSVDFGLIAYDEPNEFKALIFGDPQPYNLQELEYFKKGIVTELKDAKEYTFGISLGDISGDNPDLHKSYKEVVKEIGLPWYNVMGNHDINYEATTDKLSDESFEANFGPNNYSYNYGDAHFIILDNIIYPDPRDSVGYWAGFRDDQLEFIANDLKFVPKDKLIILAMHIPLMHEFGETFRTSDRTILFNILKDYKNVLSLSAHTHYQKHIFFGKNESWFGEKPFHEYNAGATCGDWYSGRFDEKGLPISTMRDGTPKGYNILKISANNFSLEYKAAGKPSDYQMDIMNPKVVAQNQRKGLGIVVNFFIGSLNDNVEYKIDEGDWKKMKYREDKDPKFLLDIMQWDNSDSLVKGRRPSDAAISGHLWHANLNSKLDKGIHKIQIKATDMFGKSYHAETSYKIE